MRKLYLVVALIGVGILLAALFTYSRRQEPVVASFDDCAAAGYPILESYPSQCRTPDGRSFTQDIGNELEKMNLIRITSPRPTTQVGRTFSVSGEARGPWFFEASFPVKVVAPDGTTLVQTFAQAQDEWMVESFVPFTSSVTIPSNFSGPATLVLEKDNPSGLPEHDDSLTVPIGITP